MSADVIPPSRVRLRYEDPLRRTLRGLSDPLLAALVSGLDRHRDDLAPNRLFTSRDGRSCVVGAMLRELNPADFEVGRLRFWWRHGRRTRAASYGGRLASCPRVRHLEVLFDRSVELLQGGELEVPDPQHARAIGCWIHAMAEAELGRRHDYVVGTRPPVRQPIAAVPALA